MSIHETIIYLLSGLALVVLSFSRNGRANNSNTAGTVSRKTPMGLFADLLAVDPNIADEPFPVGAESPVNLPRGIRNNNPGNIRYDGTAWQGLDNPKSDGEFCRFTNVRFGIRAMARILKTYKSRGDDSIQEIISAWAPLTENNTAAYIASVSNRMDWAESIPVPNDRWPDLIAAIIYHENGQQPYPMATIKEGVALA